MYVVSDSESERFQKSFSENRLSGVKVGGMIPKRNDFLSIFGLGHPAVFPNVLFYVEF